MSEKKNLFERIGRFFADLTDRIYRGIAKSPVGHFFTAYPAANRYFRNSGAVSLADLRHGPSRDLPVRRGMARAVDGSFLRRISHFLVGGLCRCSLRAIGTFLITTGLYCAIIAWLIGSVWQESVPSGFRLYGALGIALLGALLLISDRSVANALENSFFPRWILYGALGFSEDALKDVPAAGKNQYVIAVPLGMLFGTMIALIDPLLLLFLAVSVAVVMAIFATPEAGVILLLAYAPFHSFARYGKLFLILGALFVLLSYLFKLLRGTRVFRLEIQDLCVLLLLAYTFAVGITAGTGGLPGVLGALLLMGLYFPVVNMLSSPHWLVRARWTVMISATAAAIVGIFQFILTAVLSFQGAGSANALEIGRAVCAGFSDHAAFAYFLVLAFPFSLHAFLRAKARYRMPAGFACVAIFAAVALTWVQSAWIALLVEILVFFLIYERRTLPYFSLVALLIPVIWLLLPDALRVRFGEFMYATADMSALRIGAAGELAERILFGDGVGFFGRGAGVLRMLFGLGYGGLEAVAVLYTATPVTEAVSTFNFWSYRFLEGGLLGVLLPAGLLLLLLQNFFSLLPRAPKKSATTAPIAAITTVFGVVVISIFQYAWQDPAAMMLFFTVIAILTADARSRRAGEPILTPAMQSADAATVDYRLQKQVREKKKKRTKSGAPELSVFAEEAVQLSIEDVVLDDAGAALSPFEAPDEKGTLTEEDEQEVDDESREV